MKAVFSAALVAVLLTGTMFAADKSASKVARTPEEHTRLAEKYRTRSERKQAEAEHHAERAAHYRRNPTGMDWKRPMTPQTVGYHEHFAREARQAAARAKSLAAEHEQLARGASPQRTDVD